jgi:transcription antitermination factor NusG
VIIRNSHYKLILHFFKEKLKTEKKVEESIHALIKDAQMKESKVADILFQIKVPLREVSEVKNGKKKVVSQKFLPGYVLLEMNLDGNNWQEIYSVIKNVNGVTGFVGANKNKKPMCLSMDEVRSILNIGGDIKNNILIKQKFNYTRGESVKIIDRETLPTNIVAAEKSTILFIDTDHLSHPCGNHCKFHITLINNLLRIMATKNVGLNQKLQCISQRTTREKILNYLLLEAKKHKANEFEIPFDRQSLADYLCVERSAMSAEISKLRNENILECNKNKFKIKCKI